MLDAHHRAVYRLHGALSQDIGDKRVYYVVSQVEPEKFRVCAVRYDSLAPKRPLEHVLAADDEVKCFTARGSEILRVDDGLGRYNPQMTTMVHNIDLTPLRLPAVA